MAPPENAASFFLRGTRKDDGTATGAVPFGPTATARAAYYMGSADCPRRRVVVGVVPTASETMSSGEVLRWHPSRRARQTEITQ